MSDPDTDAPARPKAKWLPILLVIVPLWLITSGGVAVWLSIHKDEAEAEAQQQRFMQEMSVERIADDLDKLTRVIGERHASSAGPAANLTRTASMIDGILGPTNTGYRIERLPGPQSWPIIRATLPGSNDELPAIWILTGYDSPQGSNGEEHNATGVAAAIAAAQAMAHDTPQADIQFIFLPHANDPQSPVEETVSILKSRMEPPQAVFTLEAMGQGGELQVLGTASEAMKALGNLGQILETPLPGDQGILPRLRGSRLPAIHVTTTHSADHSTAVHVATSTGRLVEWLRRYDNLLATR